MIGKEMILERLERIVIFLGMNLDSNFTMVLK